MRPGRAILCKFVCAIALCAAPAEARRAMTATGAAASPTSAGSSSASGQEMSSQPPRRRSRRSALHTLALLFGAAAEHQGEAFVPTSPAARSTKERRGNGAAPRLPETALGQYNGRVREGEEVWEDRFRDEPVYYEGRSARGPMNDWEDVPQNRAPPARLSFFKDLRQRADMSAYEEPRRRPYDDGMPRVPTSQRGPPDQRKSKIKWGGFPRLPVGLIFDGIGKAMREGKERDARRKEAERLIKERDRQTRELERRGASQLGLGGDIQSRLAWDAGRDAGSRGAPPPRRAGREARRRGDSSQGRPYWADKGQMRYYEDQRDRFYEDEPRREGDFYDERPEQIRESYYDSEPRRDRRESYYGSSGSYRPSAGLRPDAQDFKNV